MRGEIVEAGQVPAPTTGREPSTSDADESALPLGCGAAGGHWAPPNWEEVVRAHSGQVYRLAYRLSGNVHDAEDLTQKTFVRVAR